MVRGLKEEVKRSLNKELNGDNVCRKDGKWKVLGYVFVGSVQKVRRNGITKEVVNNVGYHVEDLETGERTYKEREEMYELAVEDGLVNALFYRVKKGKLRIKAYEERDNFSLPGNRVPVLLLDEQERVVYPKRLVIDWDKCSERLKERLDGRYERKG